MNIRAHVFVSGRVQGVFYRAFTRERAMEHGVSGWVRNLSDGRVEAVLEGEKEAINRVVAELRVGPPAARVDDLKVVFEEPAGEYSDFQVKY